MKPPAIGSVVDVPTLHRLLPYGTNPEFLRNGQRGSVIELIDIDPRPEPADPLVCLEIDRPDGPEFAWFCASDIFAGMISDPEFSLTVDAIISRHRPRRLADGRVKFFLPETKEWFCADHYEGPTDR